MVGKAMNLREALRVLTPKPLEKPEELARFYSSEPNLVRGGDKIARIKLGLEFADMEDPYKAFLIGHSGSGKSTELSRLINEMSGHYRFVRFDIRDELDPVNFKPFDVLLLMMIKLVEQTALPIDEGGSGYAPSDALLENIWCWYHNETVTLTRHRTGEVKAEVGIGAPKETWWPKIVQLIASIKGEIKLTADREEKVVNHRLCRTNELIELMNELLKECNKQLDDSTGCAWVFVGESFDKSGIPRARVEDLFLNYSNILQELETHLVFNIPLSLVYSEKGKQLPPLSGGNITIPDTPVFHADHTPHIEGRRALADVLNKRLDENLFAPEQQRRLIVGSGGNIRNLFLMTSEAVRCALLRNPPGQQIESQDVDRALVASKREYEGALGTDPFDEVPLTWADKADKLMQIYKQDPTARIRDSKLNALLRAQAVLEFNGNGWFGVHPLVVDILNEQGRIPRDNRGVVPGGTE